MSAVKVIAIVLIMAGLWGLIDGSFSYSRETQKTQQTKSGALALSVKDTQTVYVPVWVGIGAIIAGGLLLILDNKKD